MKQRNFFIAFLMLVFLCLLTQVSRAALPPAVILSQVGDAAFVLEGKNFVDIGAFYATVKYDTKILTSPSLSPTGGWGPLLASGIKFSNSPAPGEFRIVGIASSGVTGSGIIATINFQRTDQSQGGVTDVKVQMGTSKGVPVLVEPKIIFGFQADHQDPVPGPKDPDTGSHIIAQSPTGTTRTSAPVGGGNVVSGSVTLPPDLSSPSEKRGDSQPIVTDLRKDMQVREQEAEPAATTAASTVPEVEVALPSYKAALDLFREFADEATPRALMGLFADASLPGITQVPAIAYADGTSRIKVSYVVKPGIKETPKFALQGAKITAFVQEDDGSWTIEALPKKGTSDVVLSVSLKGRVQDVPLTVVPRVSIDLGKSGKPGEADFLLFLREKGTPKAPRYDLNGDGKRDYLDNYIFTANYLKQLNIKPVSAKAKEPPTKDSKEKGKAAQPAKPEPTPKTKEVTTPGETVPAPTRNNQQDKVKVPVKENTAEPDRGRAGKDGEKDRVPAAPK
jgi:cohesin domain-containing protein